jgi:hypothetical protein
MMLTLPITAPVLADVFARGTLNIVCTCPSDGGTSYTWHHVVEVPSDSFVLDINAACEATKNNQVGPEELCTGSSTGSVYAFDATS